MNTEKWCGQCQRYVEKPCFFLLEAAECQRKRLKQLEEDKNIKQKDQGNDNVG